MLRLDGKISGGTKFAVKAEILTDGHLRDNGREIFIENAENIRCIINIATSHKDLEQELISYGQLSDYLSVHSAHIHRFKEMMDRYLTCILPVSSKSTAIWALSPLS